MKIVTNHWGWTPLGMLRWARHGWAWPIAVWGIEHAITNERCNALIEHFGGIDVNDIPPAEDHRIYRRRVKIGPFCFGAGMYQGSVSRLKEPG